MEQANKTVPERDLLHDLHRQLVVIGCDVGCCVNGGKLMLRRGDFVVFGLRQNAKLPQLLVEVFHECCHAGLDGAEVVIVQLLSLRRLRAEERSAAEDEILALVKHLAVDQEILLLRSDGGFDAFDVLISEELQNAQRLLVDCLHRAQQRCFLIERFAAIGAERRRNAERFALQESVGRGVPGSVASCLKCRAQTARRERGSVRLALNQLLAGKFHDHAAVRRRADEAVVLFGGDAGQRLEPVRKVCCAMLDRPIAHGLCHGVCHLIVQTHPFIDGLFQGLVNLLRKSGAHDSVVKHQTSEIIRNRLHPAPLLSMNQNRGKASKIPKRRHCPGFLAV